MPVWFLLVFLLDPNSNKAILTAVTPPSPQYNTQQSCQEAGISVFQALKSKDPNAIVFIECKEMDLKEIQKAIPSA